MQKLRVGSNMCGATLKVLFCGGLAYLSNAMTKYILHVLLRQQTIQNMTQFLVFDLLRCFLCAVFN